MGLLDDRVVGLAVSMKTVLGLQDKVNFSMPLQRPTLESQVSAMSTLSYLHQFYDYDSGKNINLDDSFLLLFIGGQTTILSIL